MLWTADICSNSIESHQTTLSERKQTQKEPAELSHLCEGQEEAELICDDRTRRGNWGAWRGSWEAGHACVLAQGLDTQMHSFIVKMYSLVIDLYVCETPIKYLLQLNPISLNITCLEWWIWN